MAKTRVKRRKYASYKSGLLLIGVILFVWFIARGFQSSGLPSSLASLINADFENFRNLEQFDSAKSEEVRKLIAGFWTFSEGGIESSPVAKREYMEINANGMVWHVTEWFINAPGGGGHKITHVVMAYIKPYSYSPDNESFFCETRVVRQAFIADSDTCYGASQVDEIWQVSKAAGEGAVNVNRRDYERYTGELSEFFPDVTALDIIDRITLSACPAAANISFFSKRLLARSINAVPFFQRAQSVEALIRDYYKPMALDELARRYDPRAVPDEMAVRLTVSAEGAVTDMKYKPAQIVTKRFDDVAAVDIRSWLFAPVGDTDDAQTIGLTIKVK